MVTRTTKDGKMASKEYTELKKEVEGVKNQMTKLCNKVDKIHNAIVGDLTLGQEGLVRMVKNHKNDIYMPWASLLCKTPPYLNKTLNHFYHFFQTQSLIVVVPVWWLTILLV